MHQHHSQAIMASLAKRVDGHWRARYRDAAGNEHSRHFKRKVDAQHWPNEVTTAATTGMYVDPGRSRITEGDYPAEWIATKVDLKATTRARYEGILRTNVLPHRRTVRLVDVTHGEVAAWIAVLTASGLVPSTVRQIHRVFALSLTPAVRDGRRVTRPTTCRCRVLGRARRSFLTVDQVEDLAEAAGDYRVAILFLAYTGVRFGELSGLRVRRLDLLRRRAEIVEAVAEVGGAAVFSSPKSHQVRSVPTPRFLVDDLVQSIAGKAPEGFVFTSPRGDCCG